MDDETKHEMWMLVVAVFFALAIGTIIILIRTGLG